MMNMISKLSFLLEGPQKRGLVFIFILMLVGMVFESFGIALILPLLAAITQPNIIDTYPIVGEISALVGVSTQKQLIIVSIVAIVVAYFFKAIFLLYSGWIQGKFTAGLKVDISQRLFSIYMHQPYTFHLQRNSAQLIRNVTGEVFELISSFAAAMSLLSELLIIIGIGILLFIVEPIGLVSIICTIMLFGSLFYILTKGKTLDLGIQRQAHEVKILQHLQQGLGGFKDAKLLGREDNFIKQYQYHSKKSAKVGVVYGVLGALPRHMFELLAVVVLAFFVYIVLFISNKEVEAIVPTLGVFAMAAFRIMPSANKILSNIQGLRYNLPVINRIYDEMLLPIEKGVNDKKHQTKLINNIQVKNVSYLYPSMSDPAISNVNIHINNGSTIGFIGSSGAGKSSILKGIFFALFGDGNKVQTYGKTSCKVELYFDDMKIIRTKRPNRLVVNAMYEDDAGQEVINKKFGNTFKTSGYIQQNNLNSFMVMPPADKLEFLEKLGLKYRSCHLERPPLGRNSAKSLLTKHCQAYASRLTMA